MVSKYMLTQNTAKTRPNILSIITNNQKNLQNMKMFSSIMNLIIGISEANIHIHVHNFNNAHLNSLYSSKSVNLQDENV